MKSRTGGCFNGREFLTKQGSTEDVFTPEDFNEEHRMIAETAQRFVDQKLLPLTERIEKLDLKLIIELLRTAGELGLLGVDVPQKYGGLGFDKLSSLIISEKISQMASFAVSYGAHSGIGTLPIVYFGSEEQKHKYLPKLVKGELFSAYALTESGAGSDALSSKTKAVLSPDKKNWMLSGEKIWVTNAGFADLFIVFAKIDGIDFSAFIVERNFSGVYLNSEEKKMGIRGSSTRSLTLRNVPVPIANLLGEQGKGRKIALNTLNIGRLKLGVGCVGAAKKSIDESIQYALDRHQFGQPISEFGAIREKLAAMAIRIWVAETISYRTVGMIDKELQEAHGNDPLVAVKAIEKYAIECSIVKVWCAEMVDFVVDEAVQIYGGNGYIQGCPAERHYRDSRINRIYEGTNEINRLLISGRLLRHIIKSEFPLETDTKQISAKFTKFPQQLECGNELSEESLIVENTKKATFLIVNLALQKHGKKLVMQQEILMSLADMIMETYALESSIIRGLKIAGSSTHNFKLIKKVIRLYAHDSIDKIRLSGRKILGVVVQGNDLEFYASNFEELCAHKLIPSISIRRQVARALLDAGGYKALATT